MAKLIIDGYNLLPVTMAKDRDQLLDLLKTYKKHTAHQVVVVFDGTHQGTGFGSHYHEGGVEVVFTPLTVTADDHIIEEMLPVSSASGLIVVSSDRKIQRAAEQKKATYLSSQDFAKTLVRSTVKSNAAKVAHMDEAFARGRDLEPEEGRPKVKRGNPRKLSKKERMRKRALRKI